MTSLKATHAVRAAVKLQNILCHLSLTVSLRTASAYHLTASWSLALIKKKSFFQ